VTGKPRLLYLSPVIPAVTGNGLAMRAAMVLRCLAEQYDVYLLVVPLYLPYDARVPGAISDLCRCAVVAPLAPIEREPSSRPRRLIQRFGLASRRSSPWSRSVEEVGRTFRDVAFDVVHVFRLAMLPFARPYLWTRRHRPRRHLDLDDLESRTRRQLAALYRLNGVDMMARVEDAEADRSRAIEEQVLRGFDRVYVCSEVDRARLEGRSSAHVCLLPNALPVPEPLPGGRGDGPFSFLFVGTLGYYPNEDAVRFFCGEVVPLIRRGSPRAFSVTIVGSGVADAPRPISGVPEARLVGIVPDVAPWYRDADAVVVPIRAGGGTRIKVLEAFSYRRAVVSTAIGIEGIDARDGEHVLVGDTPAAFAERCLRLMDDPALAERLTAHAYALFREAYTTEVVARSVAVLSEPPLRTGSRSTGWSRAPR
jgi:polysaccharide biosynthesis protein PslH